MGNTKKSNNNLEAHLGQDQKHHIHNAVTYV